MTDKLFLNPEHDDPLWRYHRDCRRKHRFARKPIAKARARSIRKAGNGELYVYACPHCDGFHLTKQPPEIRD